MASKRSTKKGGGKRKSRAESVTGKKAASVEVRKLKRAKVAGEQPEETAALALPKPADWNHHYKTIAGYQDKLETAKSHLQSAMKAANECIPGLAATIKRVRTIERQDPAEFRAEMERLGFGLAQIGAPVQLAIFDANMDPEKQAKQEGLADGKGDRGASAKYPEGSKLHAVYMEGWAEGQGQMALFGKRTGAANGKGRGGDGRPLDPDDNDPEEEAIEEREPVAA